MPKCIYRTCPHYTGRKCFYPGITLHVFPRELRLVKQWLQQTGQYFDEIDTFAEKIASAKLGSYRMCSAHFDPKCYVSQGAKVILKSDAVPTIFPGNVVPCTVDVKQVPLKRKLLSIERSAVGKSPRWFRDVAIGTEHGLQVDAGTQTKLTKGTYRYCVSSMPPWLTQDKGVQWPEYEFNYYGEDWKVKMDHMYYNSRLKHAQKHAPARPSTVLQCGPLPPVPFKPETESPTTPETPEGYFFSKCSLRNKKTLCTLQTKLVALMRHMMEAPHMGSYKRSRTRKLLNQIVEIVCLMVGEDMKLVNMNKDLSQFYQKQGEIPVRYQDVAVFFTKEEWKYVEDNEEIYKKDILGDPAEAKEDLYDYILDEFEEDTNNITDDYFFKLLKVNSQGSSQSAVPRGRRRKSIPPNIVTDIPENLFEEECHEDTDWNNNGNCSLEHFSDKEDDRYDKEQCDQVMDLGVCSIADVIKEETVSDYQDYDPILKSIKMETDCSTDIVKEEDVEQPVSDPFLKSIKTEAEYSTDDASNSHAAATASSSCLWIAQDGTTSTQWTQSTESLIKRPRGRRKKLLAPEAPEKPAAALDTGTVVTASEAAQEEEPSKPPQHPSTSCRIDPLIPREETFRCYICKNCFPNKEELKKHQSEHRDDTPQKCDQCPSAFDFRADLDKHKAKKHNRLRYPCDICGLQYNYLSQFIIHFRTHTGEKPFRCKECGHAFGHKCSLLLHMKKHMVSSSFKCSRCEKLLDSEQALEKHSKLRFCSTCKKCFTRRALKLHGETHKAGEVEEHDS